MSLASYYCSTPLLSAQYTFYGIVVQMIELSLMSDILHP